MVEVSTTSSAIIDFEGESSLAVEADEEANLDKKLGEKSLPSRNGKGANQRIGLDCLHVAIKKFGSMQQVDGKRNKCVKLELWRDEFKAKMGSDMEKTSFNKAWSRLKTDLSDIKKVEIYGDLCWVVYPEDEDLGEITNVVKITK
jgi:hypothetical protein